MMSRPFFLVKKKKKKKKRQEGHDGPGSLSRDKISSGGHFV